MTTGGSILGLVHLRIGASFTSPRAYQGAYAWACAVTRPGQFEGPESR